MFFWELPVSGGVLTSGWKPQKRKNLMVARSMEFHLRLSSRLFDYALAVLSVLFMAFVRLTLKPMIGKQLYYAFILAAIIVSIWYGGLGHALLAMLLGFLAGSWLFFPTRSGF
jgi:K+-sensing histidine kinase KdpD